MTDPGTELQDMVRRVVDGNRYMTLGTVGPDGLPRLTPVYYTHDGYQTFYWVSSPDAQHSRNLTQQPALAIVIFDSGVDPAKTRAVYLDATAEEVPELELGDASATAFRSVGGGAKAFTPDELSGPAVLRLYRATATSHAVHIRGGDPTYGTGVDRRLPVAMPGHHV
jgi:hypothetical protein